ncbi:nicotinamide/nicotinic acid mononucleotide adenylyltransferase 3-like [Oppia nitens]|uniref:nicotinamide/nicotinic acid mononucleotide adenylyltransferase 3-like n=1 Tax=Oppia nitens TaxID=1686743 RepID=UPI0023DBF4DF|nr:nicotinamide/nicotinic acid mononucleotide adenylyltransferase 3-like [Oppia nitens]
MDQQQQSPTRTVLLSCGSFNPITNMHLRLFEVARDALQQSTNSQTVVTEGIISPTHQSYATSKRLAPAEHRCRMIELAVQPLLHQRPHWVRCDRWETEQPGWTRTLAAMDHYRKQYPPDVQLRLLCGADLFDTFNVPDLWRDEDIETICGQYGMVVVTRQGSDPWRTLDASPKAAILNKYRQNIVIVEETIQNTVSSSAVRQAIKSGQSIRYLCPDSVIEYIDDNQLYQ